MTAPIVCAYYSSPVLADRTDAYCGKTCAQICRATGRQLITVSDTAFDRLDEFATATREQPAAVLERFINRALDARDRHVSKGVQ